MHAPLEQVLTATAAERIGRAALARGACDAADATGNQLGIVGNLIGGGTRGWQAVEEQQAETIFGSFAVHASGALQ